MQQVHLIEPTLTNRAGHCFGYVNSLINASDHMGTDLKVWAGKGAEALFPKRAVQGKFSYKLRKLQMYFLYKKLLRAGKVIFVPTAGRLDLVMIARLLGRSHRGDKVFLHFHQFRESPKKIKLLADIAKQHPEIVIMAPTKQLLAIFERAGFQSCYVVPCPTMHPKAIAERMDNHIKIVYPGAARLDKGFVQVVNFIAYLQKQGAKLPISLQASPPHSGRYDKKVQQALARLQDIPYEHLHLCEKTRDMTSYLAQFIGGIALLIYDPKEYANKFSGATLDALYAGAPVITVPGTWMGDVVTQYEAGLTVADREPETVYRAAKEIYDNYSHYHRNAVRAGIALEAIHKPETTLEIILGHLNKTDRVD